MWASWGRWTSTNLKGQVGLKNQSTESSCRVRALESSLLVREPLRIEVPRQHTGDAALLSAVCQQFPPPILWYQQPRLTQYYWKCSCIQYKKNIPTLTSNSLAVPKLYKNAWTLMWCTYENLNVKDFLWISIKIILLSYSKVITLWR